MSVQPATSKALQIDVSPCKCIGQQALGSFVRNNVSGDDN
jgi:hypothetical protein